MQLKYTMKQNKSVSEELLSEMVSIHRTRFFYIKLQKFSYPLVLTCVLGA